MGRKRYGRLTRQCEKVREPALSQPHRGNENEHGLIHLDLEGDFELEGEDDWDQGKGIQENQLPAEVESIRQEAWTKVPLKSRTADTSCCPL